MTWAEWVNSEYNTIEAIVSSSNTIQSPQAAGQTLYYDGNIVHSSDTIIEYGIYTFIHSTGGGD